MVSVSEIYECKSRGHQQCLRNVFCSSKSNCARIIKPQVSFDFDYFSLQNSFFSSMNKNFPQNLYSDFFRIPTIEFSLQFHMQNSSLSLKSPCNEALVRTSGFPVQTLVYLFCLDARATPQYGNQSPITRVRSLCLRLCGCYAELSHCVHGIALFPLFHNHACRVEVADADPLDRCFLVSGKSTENFTEPKIVQVLQSG